MDKASGLTDEEKMLEMEIAQKQRILELRRQKEELDQELAQPEPVNLSLNAGQPVFTQTTQTAMMTVKKETEHQYGESKSKSVNTGISVNLGKGNDMGLNHGKTTSAQMQWIKTDKREGSIPIVISQPMGSGATGYADPVAAFSAMMGVTSEDIKAIQYNKS